MISKFFKSKFLILSIVILALALRLYRLGDVPISPDWDEAALGYNAYSILHTARDEYGKFLPVIFRSFDDYKPGLYVYLIVPFIQLLGLSVFSVRLPSAIIGTLAVFGVYLLTKEIFKGKKWLPELSALLLAISPWHIQFSHAAFEASVGMALNLFMVLFFIKGLKKPLLLFPSALLAVCGINVYQSEKLFVPLLVILLISIYFKDILKVGSKYIVAVCLFGLILLSPLISYTLTNKAVFARAEGVSVFADVNSLLQGPAERLIFDRNSGDLLGLVLDNRRVTFLKTIASNYLTHFDLNWLFITGDIARHHAPGMGIIYLWELPLLLIGIYSFFFSEFSKKIKFLIFGWFLLAPIPASVTSGVPHAIRTLNFLPLFQIFVGFGIISSAIFLLSIKIKLLGVRLSTIAIVLYSAFIFLNIIYYFDQYFVQQNFYNAGDWQYGYAKMVPFVGKYENRYRKIVVSNEPHLDQSYIFFLFYLKYDPALYQKQSINASGGFKEEHWFGKFQFRPIVWDKEDKVEDVLYVGRIQDFPANAKKIYEVDFPYNKPAMVAVEGQ